VSELPLILVIEDEYFLQADLEKALTEAGFATDIVSSGEEALTLLMGGLKRPNVLITDVRTGTARRDPAGCLCPAGHQVAGKSMSPARILVKTQHEGVTLFEREPNPLRRRVCGG
jgi:hypothetical protein